MTGTKETNILLVFISIICAGFCNAVLHVFQLQNQGKRDFLSPVGSITGGISVWDAYPSAWQKSYELVINNRISIGKWHLEFFHFIRFNTNLSANITKFRHIVATKSSIINSWIFGK